MEGAFWRSSSSSGSSSREGKTRGDVRGRSQLECRRVFLRSLTRRLCPSSPLSRPRPNWGPQNPLPPPPFELPLSVCLQRGPLLVTRALRVTYSCCGPASPPTFRPALGGWPLHVRATAQKIQSDVEIQAPQSAAPSREGGRELAFDAAGIATSIASHSLEEAA